MHFICTAVDATGLGSLLISCPGLSILGLGCGIDSTDFNSVGDALRKYGTNLETLSLVPNYRSTPKYNNTGSRIGSLRGLLKLKKLDISREMLVGIAGGRGTANYEPLTVEEALPEHLDDCYFYPDGSMSPASFY